MHDENWRESIKAGDSVIIGSTVYPVKRTTNTQIVVQINDRCEWKFRRGNGWLIGANTWSHQFIQEATSDAVAKIKDREMRTAIRARMEAAYHQIQKAAGDAPTDTLTEVEMALTNLLKSLKENA